MIKSVGLVLLAVSQMIFFTGCDSSVNAQNKSLVMGVSADYPPFEYKKGGEIMGLDIDIARAISREIGFELTIQDLDFSALIPSLGSGRIDFIMSGMTASEERKKSVDFSQVYYTSHFALLFPQAQPLTADLQGKKIGVQMGSTMEKFIKAQSKVSPGIQIVSLSRNPVLIQEVKAGRLDGMIVEEAQAVEFVKANPGLKSLSLEGSGDGYAVAFPKKGSEEIKKKFNDALVKLRKTGKLEELRRKWMGNSHV